MRSFVMGLGLIAVCGFAAAAPCEPQLLRPEVLKLVKPLVDLRTRQTTDQATDEGIWKGESPVTPEVERRFEALLHNRTKAGDEALAFLLNIYMGEHSGEELVCEVTNRGRRMLPLIDRYSKCTPLTGLEPLHKFVRGSGTLPGVARGQIAKGEKCQYEE